MYLNIESLPISMLAGQLAGPLTAVLYLAFPSINLNAQGAVAYAILPSLLLQVAALLVYYKVEGAAPAARTDSLQQLGESPGARQHARAPLLKSLAEGD
jgi:hypothetical protein